jgi:hypothetical protein
MLPLALLVAALATTDDVDTPLSVHNLAVLAHALHGRAHAVLSLLDEGRGCYDRPLLE